MRAPQIRQNLSPGSSDAWQRQHWLTAPTTAANGDSGIEGATIPVARGAIGVDVTTAASTFLFTACGDTGCSLGAVIHEGGADVGCEGGRDADVSMMAGLATTNDAAGGNSATSGSSPASPASGNPQVVQFRTPGSL